MRLFFVTPAFRRYALAEVCFDQWKQVSAALAAHGVELRVVVISDDDNLDIARAAGFDTVERDNRWLGRRFNDGYEHAAEQGADWIAAIGSDSWIMPEYLLPLPEAHQTRRGHLLTCVRSDRLAELYVTNLGVGPYLYHRSQLEHCAFRPCEDNISKGCDTSTWVGVAEGYSVTWDERDVSQYQHISFRAYPHLTRYTRLWAAYGVRELHDPWSALAEHYPPDLVARARRALELDTQVNAGARYVPSMPTEAVA